MELPIVVQDTPGSRRDLLESIVEDAYRGPVQSLPSREECQHFLDRRRVLLAFVELETGSDEMVNWIREAPADFVGTIGWSWTEEQLRPYVNAGLVDYVMKPYQPSRLVNLVEGRSQAHRQRQ